MTSGRRERWSAATGYLVVALGIAGMALERGAPTASAPAAESLAYFVEYRGELLAQSLLFVLGSGVYVWFFGVMRDFLARSRGAERLAGTAFGAGIVWAGLQLVLQSFQIAVVMSARDMAPALAGVLGDVMYAVSVVAYVPLAVMLAAVAVASLRTKALPTWLAGFSAVFAAANVVMSLGIAVDSPLLVPGGALTYALYLMLPIWLISVTTVMFVRLGRSERTA